MRKRLLRLIGKVLVIIGIPIFVLMSYGVYFAITYTGEYGPLPSQYYQDIAILPLFMILDICAISIGVILLKRFKESIPFLIKDGGPIHSGKPWKKEPESGLYLTSCGLVVSINLESRVTAHVGYKLIPAERATHRDCALREGRAIMDSGASGRDGA
ncbi:MAG: hypothetical protein ACXAC0_08220 [Candidatus Thorarchaeota archaeon]|jgi:hypothetical protein